MSRASDHGGDHPAGRRGIQVFVPVAGRTSRSPRVPIGPAGLAAFERRATGAGGQRQSADCHRPAAGRTSRLPRVPVGPTGGIPCRIRRAGRPARRAASVSLPTAIVPPPGELGATAILVIPGSCGAGCWWIGGRLPAGLQAPAARNPGILRAGGWPGSRCIGSLHVSPGTPGRPGVAGAARRTGTSPAQAAGVAPGPGPCHVRPLARGVSGRTLGPAHLPIASARPVPTGCPLSVPAAIAAGPGGAPGGTRSGPTMRLAVAVPRFVRERRSRHLGRTLGLRLAPRLIP